MPRETPDPAPLMPPVPDARPHPCRLLATLALSADQWQALRRQGFVSTEPSRSGLRYKLRFRCGGRQVVKCLGRDLARAAEIAAELAHWQRARHAQRQHGQRQREVARTLRTAKARLQPLVEAAGFRFHGRAIRRPRAMRS